MEAKRGQLVRSCVGDIYDVPSHTLFYRDERLIRDNLDTFIEWCDILKIKTASSRVSKYQKYLYGNTEKPSTYFREDCENMTALEVQLHVLREVHELIFIMNGLKKKDIPGLAERVSGVIGGRSFAPLDHNSQSRDWQFELRMASYFSRRGYKLDLSTETDIVAKGVFNSIYIECKRIRGHKALLSRLAEAEKQIINRIPPNTAVHRYFGLCCLDVTQLVYDHNEFNLDYSFETTRHVARAKVMKVRDEIQASNRMPFRHRFLGTSLHVHNAALSIVPTAAGTFFTGLILQNWPLTPRELIAGILLRRKIYRTGVDDDALVDNAHRPRKRVWAASQISFQTDHEVIDALLERGEFLARNLSDTILTIIVAEKEVHKFSYFEIVSLFRGRKGFFGFPHSLNGASVFKQWRKRRYPLPDLAAMLFMQRFPFEARGDAIWGKLSSTYVDDGPRARRGENPQIERARLKIPTGTQFAPDETLVKAVEDGTLEALRYPPDEVVFSIRRPGGREKDWDDFTFGEFKIAWEERERSQIDFAGADIDPMLKIAATLLRSRYPYLGSPRWLD